MRLSSTVSLTFWVEFCLPSVFAEKDYLTNGDDLKVCSSVIAGRTIICLQKMTDHIPPFEKYLSSVTACNLKPIIRRYGVA